MVPAAPPVEARVVQPPHASQGVHRRRGHGLHGRDRDRRRVGWRCPQRERVARHALPHPRTRSRWIAGRVPRQLGRDRPRALRPGVRPLPGAAQSGVDHGDVCAGRVRDGMERHRHPVPSPAADRGEVDPAHDRVLRARARAHGPAVRCRRPRHRRAGAAPRASRRQALRAARRPELRTRAFSTTASPSGASSRRCSTRR